MQQILTEVSLDDVLPSWKSHATGRVRRVSSSLERLKKIHEVLETVPQLKSNVTHVLWHNEFQVRDSGSAHLASSSERQNAEIRMNITLRCNVEEAVEFTATFIMTTTTTTTTVPPTLS